MVLSPGDWKVLKTHVMRRDAVETALDSLARGNMDAWVFIGDQWYVTNPNGQYVPLERRTVGYDGVVVKSFDDIDLDSVQKIVGSTPDAPALERLEIEFRDSLEGPRARVALAVVLHRYHAAAGQQGRGGTRTGETGWRRTGTRCGTGRHV